MLAFGFVPLKQLIAGILDRCGDLLSLVPFARALPSHDIWVVALHSLFVCALDFFGGGAHRDSEDLMRRSADADPLEQRRTPGLHFRVRKRVGLSKSWRFYKRRLGFSQICFSNRKARSFAFGAQQRTDSDDQNKQSNLHQIEKVFRTFRSIAFHQLGLKRLQVHGLDSARDSRLVRVLLAPLVMTSFTLTSPTAAAHALTWITGCAQLAPATRTGSPGCWAKLGFNAKNPQDATICLSEKLWKAWLEKQAPASLCGKWNGHWQTYSPPVNATPVLRSAHEKRLILRFVAHDFPIRPEKESYSREKAAALLRVVEQLRERLHTLIAPFDPTGTATYLVTGTRKPGGALPLLMSLGFVHVLTASGIHLYALARVWSLFFELTAQRAGLSTRSALAGARTAATFTAFLAWLLGGARIGMLRPALIVAMRRGFGLLGWKWRKGAPLAAALAIDLMVAVLRDDLHAHSGRWIYALACGGGLLARSAPGMAVGSWLIAALWQGWAEGWVAIATPVLSLATVSIFSVIIYPTALASLLVDQVGLSMVAATIAQVCGAISDLTVSMLCRAVMSLPLSWVVDTQSWVAGLVLGSFTVFVKVQTRLLALVACILIRVALASASPTQIYAERVEQLDVGQGDSALVTSSNIGLIDTGSEHSLNDRSWVELLAQRGLARIDWIALTHLDEDHAGGVLRLARLTSIRCIATSRAQLTSERGQEFQKQLGRIGVRITDWSGGCVPYPVLAPPSELRRHEKPNASMSAIIVPLPNRGFYLSAGDATAEDELRIGAWAKAATHSSPRLILKISHHGSLTSSHPQFLKMLSPARSWISSGAGNSYGHPAVPILEELKTLRIPVERTDLSGSLSSD